MTGRMVQLTIWIRKEAVRGVLFRREEGGLEVMAEKLA